MFSPFYCCFVFLVCHQSYKNHKQSNIFYSNKNLAESCQQKQGTEKLENKHITQWVYYHAGCVIPTFMVHWGCSAVCRYSYKHRTDAVMKSFQLIYLFEYYSEELQVWLHSHNRLFLKYMGGMTLWVYFYKVYFNFFYFIHSQLCDSTKGLGTCFT